MHLVPPFSGRTRGPAGAFSRRRFARSAPLSPDAPPTSPGLAAPALPPSAEHGTVFGTTASFHCRAVLTQLPRDGEEKTMRQKSASARLPAFSRDGKPLRPFPPLPLSHAPFSPHKNFRASVPLRGIRPEVTPKHAPCPQTHRPVLLQEAAPGSPHYGTS